MSGFFDFPEDARAFIRHHATGDVASLSLMKTGFAPELFKKMLHQIQGRQTARIKWPTWSQNENMAYPPGIHLEQASSEATAAYKASLVGGSKCLDVTGGLGIDSFAFSDVFEEVWHCEIDPALSEIARYNFEQLKKANLHTLATDGLDFLQKTNLRFDWVFIDPSRRNQSVGNHSKVFRLQDCTPDVLGFLDVIFQKTEKLMLKVSPLLDITEAQRALPGLYEAHLVSVKHEVKELLLLLGKQPSGPLKMVVHECELPQEDFVFYKENEERCIADFSAPQRYLYEPRPAILKAGAFKTFGKFFNVNKLHPNTHLYTSDTLIKNLPARSFVIEEVLGFDKKMIKKKFYRQKVHVTTRNFPLSVASIRKNFGLQDGGDTYLFFTTQTDGHKIVLKCAKV